MGVIIKDVRDVFLQKHPEQEKILLPFQNGFDITHAEELHINNTMLFAFMLKPEQLMKESFGLEKEILLAYSPYENLQPRALQAVNMLFKVFPYINRIDTLNFFLYQKSSK